MGKHKWSKIATTYKTKKNGKIKLNYAILFVFYIVTEFFLIYFLLMKNCVMVFRLEPSVSNFFSSDGIYL